MTTDEAGELFRYWADHPPVHELVAAYFGVKPRAPSNESEGVEFVAALGGGK